MDDNFSVLEFKEEQQFRQWWIWAINLVAISVPIVFIIVMFTRDPEKNSMILTWVLTTSIILMGFVIALLWYMKLKTRISSFALQFFFTPIFISKTIRWEEIEYVELINYGFVGGWGVRFSLKYGTVYNVGGRMGLFIKLKSGQKLCVGTQKPEELRRMLAKFPSEWEEAERPWGKEKIRNLR